MTGTQSPPVTAEGLLKDVMAFFDHGEFFRAYDLAAEALELFPGNVWLAHRAVLSLANAGATALALEKYDEFRLDRRPEADVRSLLGRLKKDQAFAETGEARAALFREAAQSMRAPSVRPPPRTTRKPIIRPSIPRPSPCSAAMPRRLAGSPARFSIF